MCHVLLYDVHCMTVTGADTVCAMARAVRSVGVACRLFASAVKSLGRDISVAAAAIVNVAGIGFVPVCKAQYKV